MAKQATTRRGTEAIRTVRSAVRTIIRVLTARKAESDMLMAEIGRLPESVRDEIRLGTSEGGAVRHPCCGSRSFRHRRGCPRNEGDGRLPPDEPTEKSLKCIECGHAVKIPLGAKSARCGECGGQTVEIWP